MKGKMRTNKEWLILIVTILMMLLSGTAAFASPAEIKSVGSSFIGRPFSAGMPYAYSGEGKIVATKDVNGDTTLNGSSVFVHAYNENGYLTDRYRCVTTTSYNVVTNEPKESVQWFFHQVYEYNESGKVKRAYKDIKSTEPGGVPSESDAYIDYFYDGMGKLEKSKRYVNGQHVRTTFYSYDERGRLSEIRDDTTEGAYILMDNGFMTTKYQYDDTARVVKEYSSSSPIGGYQDDAFDYVNRLSKIYLVDDFGNIVEEQTPSGGLSNRNYYDEQGRIIRTEIGGNAGDSYWTEYSY